jgi:hypothetical protein
LICNVSSLRHQSSRTPAARTISAHLGISVAIVLPRLSGVPKFGSAPRRARLSAASLERKLSTTAPLIFATISVGVPAGATMPVHDIDTKPG